MSKVVREDKGDLSAVLTLTITKEDYSSKFATELSNHRKKAHMKGFRKGKTPMGFVKKMYGRAILADMINEIVQKEISNYLTEEKLSVLGQPLPSEDQETFDFDLSNLGDFTFIFDVGLAPEFDVKGLDKDSTFERYAVAVPAEMVTKDLDAARQRVGERVTVDENIEDNDLLTLNAEELEGDAVKEKGWATTFDILVDRIGSEDLKKEILGKKKGDKIRFKIGDIEKEATEEHLRKHILQVSEEDAEVVIGEDFDAVIANVQRVQLAELNKDFFDKFFGEGNIASEEEARAKIEEDITKYYDRQSESLLFRDFQDYLLEQNKLDLPDTFLHRWLKASNENTTEELIAKEYEDFAKNLQWSLIRGKIARTYDVTVNEDELFEGFKDQVRNYFQGYGDELVILNTANRLMQDEKQTERMYQELMSDKLFEAVREVVTITDKKIENEAFDKIIQDARAEAMQKSQPQLTEDTTDSEATEEVTEDVEQ